MTKISRTTGEITTNKREMLQEQAIHNNLYNQSPATENVGEVPCTFILNEEMSK